MINQAILVGRLTKDPDLKYSASGTAVCNFTLAIDRGFKNQAGEKETDFINVTTFKKTAENTANYTKKGSIVGVTGRIQVRNYEKDGKKVYITEVVANEVKFIGGKSEGEQQPRRSTNNDPFTNNSFDDTDISDSLPF